MIIGVRSTAVECTTYALLNHPMLTGIGVKLPLLSYFASAIYQLYPDVMRWSTSILKNV